MTRLREFLCRVFGHVNVQDPTTFGTTKYRCVRCGRVWP